MVFRDLDAAAALIGPSLAVLEGEGRPGTGFFAGPPGRIVTALHVVADVAQVRVRTAKGRPRVVDEVSGLDARRNLVVLAAPAIDAPGLPLAGDDDELREGTPVFVQGAAADENALLHTRVGSLERVGDWLTVFLLSGVAPDAAGGSPVVREDGQVVGVVARVLSNIGPLAVGVPVKHLRPLLEANEGLPLESLKEEVPKRRPIRRNVPSHPMSLLEGCPSDGLEAIGAAIIAAIQTGAPAYNDGNVDGCFRIYEETARRLVSERDDCPGPQRALRDGLARAAALEDVNAQAWAMRDTFDGLLLLLERWTDAKAAPLLPPRGPKKPLLN